MSVDLEQWRGIAPDTDAERTDAEAPDAKSTIRLRASSRRLLGSLVRPHRRMLYVMVVLLLVQQAAAMVPTPRDGQCVRVGVDGVDGVGKTVFAAELGGALRGLGRPVVNVSLDGFHHPRAVRYRRGRDSPEGFWLDSYDYQAFSQHVLEPFAPGGSREYRSAVHDSIARYVQGQRLYFGACSPWRRASLVIDNTDVARPRIITEVPGSSL